MQVNLKICMPCLLTAGIITNSEFIWMKQKVADILQTVSNATCTPSQLTHYVLEHGVS